MIRPLTFIIMLLTVGALSGVVIGLTGPAPAVSTESSQVVPHARYDSYGFEKRFNLHELPKAFDLVLPCNPPAEGPYDARVLFNYHDTGNYRFLEVTETGVALGRVENGLELERVSRLIKDPLRTASEMILHHRGNSIVLAANGEALLRTFGVVSYGGHLLYGSTGGQMVFDLPNKRLLKSTLDIAFGDDFMRASTSTDVPEETPSDGQAPPQPAEPEKPVSAGADWEVLDGTWGLGRIRNASLSSNAFWLEGSSSGPPAAIVTGNRYWSNYSFEVSCKPVNQHPMGILFYWLDSDNFFLLRWSNYIDENDPGRRELVKVHNGRRTVIASAPGGFRQNQWYRLGVTISDNLATAYIDGHEILSARDDNLCFGKAGLYNESPQPVQYDDVYISRYQHLRETFEHPFPGRWQQIGGNWANGSLPGSSDTGKHFVVSANGPAKAVAGAEEWSDYTLQSDVLGWTDGEVGLTFCYLDEGNHYLLAWASDGAVRLVRVLDGEETALATATMERKDEPVHHLLARVDDGLITVRLDGGVALEAWDNTLSRGRAGLYASYLRTVAFDNVAVDFKPLPQPVLTTNKVHDAEKSMKSWAATASDWLAKRESIDGRLLAGNWHRADFFGDTQVELTLDELPAKDTEIHLVVSAAGQRLASGYSLILRRGEALQAQLCRLGVPLAMFKVAETTSAVKVRLERRSSLVIARVNGSPPAVFNDPEPLRGEHVGCGSSGKEIDLEEVKVFSDSVIIDRFNRAPSDWRVAGGTWETTNRWNCDPRWSFFAGENKDLAAIWHRNEFGGDVTVEFACAIRMNPKRGDNYSYASDLNITLCGDGRDLDSGYNFVFGGWNDTKTAILRGNQELASTNDKNSLIPRNGSIHRRWFYLKAEKKGKWLRFYVDNRLILEAKDPQSLTGTRCAIWTWNNGIMIARARLSSSQPGSTEPPDFQVPASAGCAYR